MEREEFEALVGRLETYAHEKPKAYRLRVGLLAGLGYGYIWMVLGIVLVLIAALVWGALSMHRFHVGLLKIGFLLVLAAFAIIRSLWVKFPRPEGIPITRDKAPQLFAMLDEMSSALKAPRFHNVLLDSDFNAAVVQRPKLGMLGWQENTLLLGLPLMQGLPPEQFRAVVAHEMGHLSGNHSRFAGWIYRVAATWEQIQQNLAGEGSGGAIGFERFLRWYWPFFNAYSFVLRRADEYVADRCAAQLTSPQVAGEALVNVNVKARFLDSKFWPDLFERAKGEPEPPRQTFSNLARAFRDGIAPQDASEWASKALRDETDFDDTHPSLAQRLQALGCSPSASEPPASTCEGQDAATHYLGASVGDFTQQLDEAWRLKLAEAWGQQHSYMKESRGALDEIEAKVAVAREDGKEPHQVLDEEEMWNRARWTGDLGDKDGALSLLRELLEAHPKHANGRYALGYLLLDLGDEAGVQALEEAMSNEKSGTLEACMAIHGFLKERGRKAEANEYHKRAEAFYEVVQQAQQERGHVGPKDTFLPHELEPEVTEKLRALAASQDKVGEAILVRKQVQHFPEEPCYVLAIATRQSMAKFLSSEDNTKLLEALAPGLEGTPVGFLFVIDDSTKAVGKSMRKVEGALIYSRKDNKDDAPR